MPYVPYYMDHIWNSFFHFSEIFSIFAFLQYWIWLIGASFLTQCKIRSMMIRFSLCIEECFTSTAPRWWRYTFFSPLDGRKGHTKRISFVKHQIDIKAGDEITRNFYPINRMPQTIAQIIKMGFSFDEKFNHKENLSLRIHNSRFMTSFIELHIICCI